MNFLLASTNTDFLLSQATGGAGPALVGIIVGGFMVLVFAVLSILTCKYELYGGAVFCFAFTFFGAGLLALGISEMNESGDLEGDTRSTIHEIESEYDIEVYSGSLKDELMDLSSAQLKDNTTFLVEGFTYLYDGQMYSTDLMIAYTAESRVGPTISLYSNGDPARELTAFDPTNGTIAEPASTRSTESEDY